jgi:hypothetical protein
MKQILRFEVECCKCGDLTTVTATLKPGLYVMDARPLKGALSRLGWVVQVRGSMPEVRVYCDRCGPSED